ncbi:MAG: capsular biosynthesis protein [Muribaculaceae bacterium]|nr:capsular biosynthesis protein [Muribaculaceae bacterium]
MWPFNKPAKLENAGIFRGFTDWHSHILPGVDDGVRTMEKSLVILDRFERAGVRKVWLTPHVMEDYPNTPDSLRARFAELKEAYKGEIELRLAAENMLDSLFEERLEKNEFLPIGEEGRHLLVETSYMNPPMGMEEMMQGAMQKGYTLILAHPERYRYMDEDDYLRLKDQGIVFQSNFMSLIGAYGETARRKVEWLLKEGMVDLTGSDIHRIESFETGVAKRPKKKQALDELLRVAANPAVE